MLDEVLDTIHDLVELADQSLTKIFSDPWPPVIGNSPDYSIHHRRAHSRPHVYPPPVAAVRAPVAVALCSSSTKQRLVKVQYDNRTGRATQRTRMRTHSRPAPPSSPNLHPFSSSAGRNAVNTGTARPAPPLRKAVTRKGLNINDIQPDLDRCDVLVISIAEMEICKEIFAGWRAQLDLAEPRRKDKLEHTIISTVYKLDIGATAVLHSSHNIIRSYRALIRSIDRRLGDIAQSKDGGSLFISSEVRTLASSISAQSRSLSSHVQKIQQHLRGLVKDIEKTKEKADKRALRRKIWGWLSRAFKALSFLLSAAAIAGASMLSGAAAKLCEVAQDKYNETTFDEIIVFLRDHIPESAKAAELALTSFQACHRVLQIELEVRQGKRSGWMSQHDAKHARGHWTRADQKLRTSRFSETVD
ncbi:hypothetical protein DFH11DRAFT_1506860 [Phellopilus nigrolimitatus]|nr:hypothetical protein DFH11DRAFT_1506860 [Phellopilus nigrolimitatus]